MKYLHVIRFRFIGAIVASCAVVLLSAFKLSIVDRIMPFGMVALVPLMWAIYFATIITSLSCLTKFKSIRAYSLVPLSINLISFVVVVLVPFTELWIKADFSLYRSDRDRVVSEVLQGILQPNVEYNSSLISLDQSYPLLSMGGNEIVAEEYEGQTYILFFTYRGVLDNYSGFLHVPEGGNPSRFSDLNEKDMTYIEHIDGNWYFVLHH